jgi:L-rhamnose isomerase / sugar isomerase
VGSIDPYQVFRIFHEIRFFEWESGQRADIAYMVDQSHNLKGKIEAMIQTVTMAQQLYAKASLVDGKELAAAHKNCDLVRAESVLQDAFATDVRPAIQDWRDSKGLPKDPMEAFRQSGYLERITKERAARNSHSVSSYA